MCPLQWQRTATHRLNLPPHPLTTLPLAAHPPSCAHTRWRLRCAGRLSPHRALHGPNTGMVVLQCPPSSSSPGAGAPIAAAAAGEGSVHLTSPQPLQAVWCTTTTIVLHVHTPSFLDQLTVGLLFRFQRRPARAQQTPPRTVAPHPGSVGMGDGGSQQRCRWAVFHRLAIVTRCQRTLPGCQLLHTHAEPRSEQAQQVTFTAVTIPTAYVLV
jgi:hypothetical protein